MAKAYDLLVRVNVDLPEWMLEREHRRLQREAARALTACPRCGAPAVDRDIVTVNGRVDFTASFARFACGNYSVGDVGGELGALACGLYNLGQSILDTLAQMFEALIAAASRIASRFQRRPADHTPGSRVLHGPADVYIGSVGDPDQEPTWCHIGHTAEGVEVSRAVE